MTSKRKRTVSASDRRRRRVDPDDNPPAPNPEPEQPEDRVYNSFFNRKSKLATLLLPNYRDYKNLFRNAAEEFSNARRDAMYFVLFMVTQWFNTQRVELYAYQMEHAPQIQESLRKILHETLLMNQLRDLLQQTTDLVRQEQNIPDQYVNLLNRQAQIQNYFTEILPASQQLDDLLADLNSNINNQEGLLDYERQRMVQDTSSLHVHLILLDLLPQITHLRDITARAIEAAKNTENTVEKQLTALYNSATDDQKLVLQNARTLRDLEPKVLLLREKYTVILREQSLEESDVSRLQTIRQIQLAIITSDAALQRMREQEERSRAFFNQNEIAREYVLNIQIILQITDITDIFTKVFQNVDSTLQKIVLGLRGPEYNFIFPSITDETFWSHAYRKVLADPENRNRQINFNRSITSYFDDFNVSRKEPGTDNYRYNLPVVDSMHRGISRGYTGTIVQNVTMHLLSINVWIIRLFKGFLLFHQRLNNVQVAIMTIAKKASNKIIRHLQYEDLPNEEEIPGFKGLYDRIKLIYDADFLTTESEDLFDYESAKARPLKYLRVSYRLLQEASSHGDWGVKVWTLLPTPSSHRIVHFPLNSFTTMYGLFERANIRNIRVPDFLLDNNGNLIGITAFDDMYTGRRKQKIWETLFSINKLEKRCLTYLPVNNTLDVDDRDRRVKLVYSLTTDGHMISILFERVSREKVAFTKGELKLQKRNLNLANKTRVIYPLYKNPTGITLQDRIIGIDPGVRDIVCAVNCTRQELTNKYTTKGHSLSISNASYKLRSGMQWINQRELESRKKSGIQDSYDCLKSSKVCSSDGIKQFLNYVYQEHQNIFNFMKSYKHRENLGYAYSNRQRAQDFIARVILGTTNKEEPYTLFHTSSSRRQKNTRLKYRRMILNRYSRMPYPAYPPSIRDSNNNQRTVVAYDDASIRGTYKGNTPVPVKAIQRAIASKAVVVPVDEFRTSITCSHCFGRLENTPDERPTCTHKKKLHRSNGLDNHPDEKKAVMKCFDEEGHVLFKTSICPERVRPRRPRDIYSLKLCCQCQATNAGPLYWNRDVNAASNIRDILWRYITEGFDLNSRSPALSRIREINDEDEEDNAN